jgi:hypothetical protein
MGAIVGFLWAAIATGIGYRVGDWQFWTITIIGTIITIALNTLYKNR